MTGTEDITVLPQRFQRGEENAQEKLMPAVQGELRVLAARYMRREKGGHTLQTTALVNAAYLKLVNVRATCWQDSAHFFGVAAQIMRRILIGHAYRHIAGKRGGGLEMLPLDEGLLRSNQGVQLDDALQELDTRDPRACRVIVSRLFGWPSVEETAEVLKVSTRTVKREWTFARAWLREQLGLDAGDEHSAVA